MLEDKQLCEIHLERAQESKQTESLFYGRVQAIRPSVSAAFVDIGEPLHAFLPLNPDSRLHSGDWVLVQGIARQTTDSKGLRVTETINLPGKWLVLVPGNNGVHLSKKLKDASLREALAQIGKEICPPGCGLIIRTASSEITREALCEEAQALFDRWKRIQKKSRGMTRPGLVDEPQDLALRLVRDFAPGELSRVTTNDSRCYMQLLAAQQCGWIGQQAKITLFEEHSQLIFDAFSLETAIDKALRRRVWLSCGGYLVIDTCEALTAIDVNSGKMTLGRDTEDTAIQVNLEAADEAMRQLRLRDIGGMIVIDFIDMMQSEHRALLEARIKQAASRDRARVKVEGLTRLGLMELTRQRRGAALRKAMRVTCSYCGGTGELLAPQEVAQRALRQVRRLALAGQRGPFVIRCAPGTAQALEDCVSPLDDVPVYVLAIGRHAERFEIEQLSTTDLPPVGARPLPAPAATNNDK